jgi:hypothetical protein
VIPPAATARDLRAWLASGACQSPDGAFYAWIDHATGEPAFEYPEITGYALTHFAGRADPSAAEHAAAGRAADWLLARIDSGGDRSARGGWDGGAVYTFDLGMISTGLLAYGARAGDDRLTGQGRRLAAEIARQVHPDGHLEPVSGARAATTRDAWSTRGGAHMIKVVQCLLAAEAAEPDAGQASEALVSTAGALQQPEGRVVTHPSDRETMLHPHLYALEGLWAHGRCRGSTESTDRARRGVEWAFTAQLETGGLPRFVVTATGERGPEQLDATAQAVRMAVLTGHRPPGLERAVARLAECALPTAGALALPYQPAAAERHCNAWVSMFGVQALELALSPDPRLRWELLV